MALDISSASIGYDVNGTAALIKEINTGLIDEAVRLISTNVPIVQEHIGDFWIGASADMFKQKMDVDSEKVINSLTAIRSGIEQEIYQMMYNVNNSDSTIAEDIMPGFVSQGFANTASSSWFGNSYNVNTASGTVSVPKVDNGRNIWDDIGDGFKDFGEGILEGLERTGATLGVIGMGLIEGVGEFGEALVDFGAILGAVVETPFTFLVDITAGNIYEAVTGNEWQSWTKDYWETTMDFVGTQYVKDTFNNFYENTDAGKYLAEKSYGYETTRGISAGLGYTAGVVALSIATCGIGGAAVGGASAAAGASSTLTATMAGVATAAGMGRGTQNAWHDGATLGEGLAVGTATGIWEGLQFYLGGKISGLAPTSNGLANAGIRIGLDTATGAAEGFVQPALDLYKDGYYDKDGNYVEFTDESVAERYAELFDDNGGFAAVGTNAAIGAAGSALGEIGNIKNALTKEADVDVRPIVQEDMPSTRTTAEFGNGELPPHPSVYTDTPYFGSKNGVEIAGTSSAIQNPEIFGMSQFDQVRTMNSNSELFLTFEQFKNATDTQCRAFEDRIAQIAYKDPITGKEISGTQLFEGYIGESDTAPGGYGVINTVNRAMGNNPGETLQNLLAKDASGQIITNADGQMRIDINHCFGKRSYWYDPLTEKITLSNDPTRGLNVDGSAGTFSDLLTRVNSESKAMSEAMSTCTFAQDTVVGRGAGINSLQRYGISPTDSADVIYSKLTADGGIYRDAGFMSSTPEIGGGFMKGNDVNYIMNVKQGTSYANFNNMNSGEKEVLLDFGQSFKIDSVIKTPEGQINIYMSQL